MPNKVRNYTQCHFLPLLPYTTISKHAHHTCKVSKLTYPSIYLNLHSFPPPFESKNHTISNYYLSELQNSMEGIFKTLLARHRTNENAKKVLTRQYSIHLVKILHIKSIKPSSSGNHTILWIRFLVECVKVSSTDTGAKFQHPTSLPQR